MPNCKIHNVRFYNPEPQAVRCMALEENTKKLAISRFDGNIEIWNISNTCFLERTITSTTENFSIEDIAWCKGRLFSVGLHGLLVEYNLIKLCIENKLVVTGEAAHCLDVNKSGSQIAIGTEQGYLNLFDVGERDVDFNKFFDKQEGRIMCLKFESSGEFVVSGGIDAIRIWNVNTGHALHKMTTGRSESNKPTVIWCLEITDDFTIITGDSRGKLSFWDGKLGSHIESYQSHKADILSLCLSKSQTSLYCAGRDPNIVNYELVNIKGARKWVKSVQRKIHDHDVNSLKIFDNKLYSAGIDAYLCCSFHPPKTLLKYPPILQNPCVQIAKESRHILLRYPKFIEVWSLGHGEQVDDDYLGSLNLKENCRKLLMLHRQGKDDHDDENEGIICCAISHCGKWIFYSTQIGCRLFEFVIVDDKPNLLKVNDFEYETTPCLQAVFTNDNSHLITAPNCGGIFVYELRNGRASLSSKLERTELRDTIAFLKTSPCDKYLIAADASSNILVWLLSKNNEWKFHSKLPKYSLPPTAMAVQPDTSNLVIAYSDSKVVEYSLKKKQFTAFSRSLENAEWKTKHYPIRNVVFDPRNSNIVILQDDVSITVINKEQKALKSKSKIPKTVLDTSNGSIEDVESTFHVIKKYKHLVHLDWLQHDEMVAVEMSPMGLMEKLPPPFAQKTFGKK